MGLAHPTHARHRSPSAELRVVGLDRFQYCAVVTSTDRIDLTTDRGQPQRTACGAHLGQRLPAIGLRVVHLRRVERLICGSIAAHDVELALESDAAVVGTCVRHSCPLRPRGVLRVVQLHRAEVSAGALAAHKVDEVRPEAPAWHHLRAAECGQHCVKEHPLRFFKA
eukprot:scaffold70605_cov65-Phaeocystis_antarctica.AAC.2